jgi:hypothetical protein
VEKKKWFPERLIMVCTRRLLKHVRVNAVFDRHCNDYPVAPTDDCEKQPPQRSPRTAVEQKLRPVSVSCVLLYLVAYAAVKQLGPEGSL